jgi:hypothetical protein
MVVSSANHLLLFFTTYLLTDKVVTIHREVSKNNAYLCINYKPSISYYLVGKVTYFCNCIIRTYFFLENGISIEVKLDINSVEVHPQTESSGTSSIG